MQDSQLLHERANLRVVHIKRKIHIDAGHAAEQAADQPELARDALRAERAVLSDFPGLHGLQEAPGRKRGRRSAQGRVIAPEIAVGDDV